MNDKHDAPHKAVTYVCEAGGHVGFVRSNPWDGKNWKFVADVCLSFIDHCSHFPEEHPDEEKDMKRRFSEEKEKFSDGTVTGESVCSNKE